MTNLAMFSKHYHELVYKIATPTLFIYSVTLLTADTSEGIRPALPEKTRMPDNSSVCSRGFSFVPRS